MNANQIRQQFLDFFASKQHAMVPSSPVVPHDDPTLMFANAGMNQFKPIFLGTVDPNSEFGRLKRAANSQKCIRAGGKHNDLDDVGQDTYHHTFFEMLGNWSFGDYFKKEAIEWAWELLTKVWGIDKARLHATYFEGDESEGLEPDREAAELWRTVTDIDPSHIHPGNKKDNFWEMGDTGPCGPCSEIHVDLTPDCSGAKLVNAGDARVIELWNLVFIQFNRAATGLSPLPAKHVDTGMGFERLCAILQGQATGKLGQVSNYDTDVFSPVFKAIQKRTGAPDYAGTLPQGVAPDSIRCGGEPVSGGTHHRLQTGATQSERGTESGRATQDGRDQVMIDVSYRVIADHVRCLTFALTDGAMPSNDGRGYVLRRILRRAASHGREYLDLREPFLCDLVAPVARHMAGAFPELMEAYGGNNIEHVAEIIREEELKFHALVETGSGARFFAAIVEGCQTVKNWPFAKIGKNNITSVIEQAFHRSSPITAVSWHGWDDVSPPEQIYSEIESMAQLEKLYSGILEEMVRNPGVIPGRVAFILHDTYGFPIETCELRALSFGLSVDRDGFDELMEKARSRARGREGTIDDLSTVLQIPKKHLAGETQDVYKFEAAPIQSTYLFPTVLQSDGQHQWLSHGLIGMVFDRTCFYAEQGGQVGDTGTILFDNGLKLAVKDTKRAGNQVIHLVDPAPLGGAYKLNTGASATLSVHFDSRTSTMKNHTATHILNWALREVLCEPEERTRPHVQQKGSLVDPEKTRFDFSHNKPVSDQQVERIEALVNEQIEAGLDVYTNNDEGVDQAAARWINTLRAVFGEKYPDKVRVVSIGVPVADLLADPENEKWMQYSVEFCGGTHVKNTREIERFVITTEEAVAKGIRRVVGITGDAAKQAIETGDALLAEIRSLAGGDRDAERAEEPLPHGREEPLPHGRGSVKADPELPAKLVEFQKKLADAVIPITVRHKITDLLTDLQKQAKQIEKQQAAASGDAVKDRVAELLAAAKTIGGVTVVVGDVPAAGPDALRNAIDWVRNKTAASAVLLATENEGKVTLIAGMSKDVVGQGVKAGDLIRELAPLVGGKGGGRPDMAQGGGTDASGIPAAIERAGGWIAERLG